MRDRYEPDADGPLSFEEIARQADRRGSVRSAREGELLARQLGLTPEELDRRLQADDARRDAAGLPAIALSALRERAGLDDFGAVPVEPTHLRRRAGNPDDARATPRLSDQTDRIVTRDSDAATAAAVVGLAQAKGWPAIKVSGSPEFSREVWLQAGMRGIDVRGYKPTQADKAELEGRREQRVRAGIDPASDRKTGMAHEQITQLRQTRQTDQDYHRLTSGSRERIDKASIVEAVAAEVAVQKIKNPQTRERVLNEVHRQLNQQSAKGKDVPTLHALDRNAPTKARDVDHARWQADRDKDRSR